MRIILIIVIFCLFSSCNKQENNTIQNFIEKYKDEDFSKFNNLYIGIRQANIFETIYVINKINLPPYIVTQNNITNKISINRNLLIKLNKKDYFNENQIKDYLNLFRKYHISSISIDYNKNVYIDYKENSVTLFRVSDLRNINKNYKKLSENWYIEK